MKNLSLYLHIPFCEDKCYYCNFISKKASNAEKKNYIDFLLKEIKLNKTNKFIVNTIFIGGGTPSCLNKGDILKILKGIKQNFKVSEIAEISIEINPNSFNEEKAIEYKNAGINRLSFGLQSSNNKILKSINRLHTKKDFINAIKLAQKHNFNNINADILMGLPNQKLKDLKNTLKLLVKLKLNHISCYSLILEENTKLFSLIKDKKLTLPSEEKTIKMFDYTLKFLEKNKLFRYEVSNFAKKGIECKHNLVYWNLENYLGLGLNSHSKIKNERIENFSDFNSYYENLKNNKKPIKNKHTLTKEEEKEEFIMLGLRKETGINLQDFFSRFNFNLEKEKATEINFLLKNGFIEIVNNNLKATKLGFKVLNNIILQLI